MESPKALPSVTANQLHPPPNTATAPTHSNVGLRLRLIQPTLLPPPLQTKRLAFVRGVLLFGGGNAASCGGSAWRVGIRMMASPKALPSVTANRRHPPPQHRNRTYPLERRITPSANPTYVAWTSRCGRSLFVRWNRRRRFRRLPRIACNHQLDTATVPTLANVGLRLRLIQPTLPEHRGAVNRFSYDGIAKGASIGYRDWATPPTADPTYTFGSLIRRGGKDA